MKKVIVTAALLATLAGPALAADLGGKMVTKAPPVVAPIAYPWDVAFGTALTTDYVLRGISQSDRSAAIQGYVEPGYRFNDMVQVYAGIWGSSLWTGAADAEFDIYGGARFTWDKFGLDVGYVQYEYPGGSVNAFFDYAEWYAKPSYTVNDWLTLSGTLYWGDNFNDTGYDATYYSGIVTVNLPQWLPYGIGTSVSGELGQQSYDAAIGNTDYTTWNAGVDFKYKALTLDLRYYDTDLDPAVSPAQCTTSTPNTICDGQFVAMLKFDTSLSALK